MNYVDDAQQSVISATVLQEGTAYHLVSAGNPNLAVGTTLLEQGNDDSPRLQVTADSAQSAHGSWHTPVKLLMREYCVKYSFITSTHSTIAGSMNQTAETKAAAISQVRTWLDMIYQPVEFDAIYV